MQESAPIPMCPMAETCKGMMEKPRSLLALSLPGVIFIVLGIVVLIEPRILAWLVAAALIILGVSMLMLTRFVRRFGQ